MVPNRRKQASDEHRDDRDRCGNQQPDQIDNPETITKPASTVLQGQPATTKAGKSRQRLAWTTEMNTAVMQCYYKTTKLEKIKVGYREELKNKFLQIYPQYKNIITAQRLIDQKRYIIVNNKLSHLEIENIKQSVALSLNSESAQDQAHNNNNNNNNIKQIVVTHSKASSTQTKSLTDELQATTHLNAQPTQTRAISTEQHQAIGVTDNNNNTSITNPTHYSNPIPNTPHTIEEIENKLITNTIKWKNTDPTTRPSLPKLNFKENTNTYIYTYII